MNLKIPVIFLLLIVPFIAQAQQIIKGEYFIDNDPGPGKGIALPNFAASDSVIQTLSLNTTGLSIGYHRVYYRYKYNTGYWSIPEDRLFYIYENTPPVLVNQPLITNGEYFIDADPGVGKGTAFTSFAAADSLIQTINVNTSSSLSLGSHTVHFRYKDQNGKWGLTESRTFLVRICTLNITALASKTTICEGSTTIISTTGGGLSFKWYNGTNLLANTSSSLTVNSGGTYKVVATEANECLDTSNVVTITSNALPIVTANATNSSICAGSSTTLTGGGAISYIWSDGVSDGISFTPTSTKTYTVTGTDANSCTNTATKTISVGPTFSITASAAKNVFCEGSTSLISTTGDGATYQWYNGTTLLANTSSSYIANTSGAYKVIATNAGGCSATSNVVTITTNAQPIVTANASISTLCAGGNTILTGGGAISYVWSDGVTDGISFAPISTKTYTVTGTGANSCTNTATKTITVNPLPGAIAAIFGITTICLPQNPVTYSVPNIANATSYSWTLPTGATGISTSNSIVVNFGASAGSGNITIKGNNSCGNGPVETLPIVVAVLPSTPVITLNADVLHSDAITGNQWYSANSIINGAVNQDYTYIASDTYYVLVSLKGCSSKPSNTINVLYTGIGITDNDKSIKIFPIPFSNALTIVNEGNIGKIGIEIYNSTGQMLFYGNLFEKTVVPTTNFSPGIYYIKLKNGKDFQFKKIIKE